MDKKVRRSSRLWVLSNQNDKSLGIMASSMVHPDILGRIFQSDIANQASIKALCLLMLVCKVWHKAVKVILKNLEWLAPFTESARVFIAGSIVLPSQPPEADAFGSYIDEVYAILDSFLDEMKLHQWYEDVQHNALEKLNKILNENIQKKHTFPTRTLCKMLSLINDAMQIHDLVERIQITGCAATFILSKSDIQISFMDCSKLSPTLISCIRNIRNFSLNVNLMNDSMFIIHRFMKSSQLKQHSALEAGVIEMVVRILEIHFDGAALHYMGHEIFRSVSLTNISFLQKASVEKVVFKFMRLFASTLPAQVSCMYVLNILFDQCASCVVDLYDDLGGFELIRASTLKFSQDRELLNLVLKLFSNVVLLDNKDMCRKIVDDGCIGLMFNYADYLVANFVFPWESDDIRFLVCNTLLVISHDKTLHPALSTARVLEYLQKTMADAVRDKKSSFAICNIFRRVLYPVTMLRCNMPPMAIVELVVNGLLYVNISKRFIRDELILTIDVLMQSKRSISVVSANGVPLRIVKAMYFCTHMPMSEYLLPQEVLPPDHQRSVLLAGFRIIERLSSYHSNITLIVENPDREKCICSIVTSAMNLYPSDTLVQTAALHILDKFVSGFPHKHESFRHENGLALLREAMKLPDLDHPMKALAHKTLQLCQLHATRL